LSAYCYFKTNIDFIYLYFETATLYPGGIRSHDPYIAPVSSVAIGEDRDARDFLILILLTSIIKKAEPVYMYAILKASKNNAGLTKRTTDMSTTLSALWSPTKRTPSSQVCGSINLLPGVGSIIFFARCGID
jgi:hypothetical protein